MSSTPPHLETDQPDAAGTATQEDRFEQVRAEYGSGPHALIDGATGERLPPSTLAG